jgi:hypothetical protein
MLTQIAEWAGAVLAAGVVAGLMVAAVSAGVWLLYRRLRRHVAAFTSMAARHALQTAEVAAAVRQGRLPPRVVHDLRRRINGPPQIW